MDQKDIERHERAKRPKVTKMIDICIQCPKCDSLLSVGIPEGGGRQCNCVTCDQRLFVHKYADQAVRNEQTGEVDVCVEPAITTGTSRSSKGGDDIFTVKTKKGGFSFEEAKPELQMLAMPADVLSDRMLRKVDMCTLSHLDCTCHEMRAHVQRVTKAHALPLNLRLRKQETWSDLRLAIHCTWTGNGMGTGMATSQSSSSHSSLEPGTLAASSELHTCGSGIFGQVGHQYKVDYVLPCEVDALRGIKMIGVNGGGRHSCTLGCDGAVYTFGKGHHGQLGVNIFDGKTDDMKSHNGGNDENVDENDDDAYGPFKIIDTDIAPGQEKNVVGVSAGFDHTMIVYRNGTAKCFGRGASGRLGIDNSKSDEHKPIPITHVMNTSTNRASSTKNTKFIATGAGLVHTALISDIGEVYTVGHHRNGRLGHGRVGGMRTRSGAANVRDGEPQLVPRKITSLQKLRIIQVALGSYHTAVLTSEGEVYSFGHGSSGQLGLGNADDVHSPTKVKGLVFKGDPVIQIAAGYEHTAALTLSGAVYTFGLGERGQLGHGSQYNEFYPRIVKDLNRFYGHAVQISAGGYHTVARLEDGRVVTFGNNESGQLGHGDKEHAYVPRVIQDIAHCCVRNVSAGGTHTLLLLDALPK